MTYKRKTIDRWKFDGLKIMFAFAFVAMIPNWVVDATTVEFITPLGRDPIVIEKTKVVDLADETIDAWVDQYIKEYLPKSRWSESKMILHCLLHRESGHGASNAMGDGGLAGGILQFHAGTWTRMRKQMLDQGLINGIGDRFNQQQAIHTTIWAMSEGHLLEWGPVLRDSNGSDYASCQTPSWY